MTRPASTGSIRLELRVLGQPVVVESPRPPDPARLDQLLPLLRAIDNAAVDAAVRHAEAGGETVTCRKGCSACCRAQPVPVTPPEAYALLRLVEELPEPRRTEVKERFADRVRQLTDAGLTDSFLHRDPAATPADARTLAERYFSLGLVCPFLDDDACSIYPDRPFVCRQYLVTSPVELCSDPMNTPVKRVKMPIAAAGATLTVAEERIGTPQHTVPLTLALQYAEQHRAELERTYEASGLAKRWVSVMIAGGE
jgi:Fe-S-cluster containining protein